MSRNAAELVAADQGENIDWRQGVYQELFQAVQGSVYIAMSFSRADPAIVFQYRLCVYEPKLREQL